MSNAFRKRGHECFTVDWDEQFPSSLHIDVEELTSQMILDLFGKPDILFSGTDCCFTGNALVWTDQGYKEIKDIQCFDNVLTHTRQYKRVNKKFEKMDYQFYKLKISGCEEQLVTQHHPYLCRKKHRVNTHKNGEVVTYTELLEPEWLEAKDLTTEYRVGIPINNQSIIPKWEGSIKKRPNTKLTPVAEIVCNWGKFMDNEDFWWMIGRYIGDGYLHLERGVFNITCSKEEHDEISTVLDRLNVEYKFYHKKTADNFVIFDKELSDFVSQFGIGAYNKTITPTILNLPKNLLSKFLDGYISADGHWDYGLENPVCTMTTISRKLAYGLQQCILKAYGRYCSMVFEKKNGIEVIQGRTVNVHDIYTLGFYRDKTNRLQYIIEDGYAWVNVKKNEKQTFSNDNKQIVYNMSVQDDESYTVNNIIVHNCTYSVAAVSKNRKMDENGVPQAITEYGKKCDRMNRHVRDLARELGCEIIIENPRAMMRKMDFVQDLIRNETTYCQYGFPYMKPTDFFASFDLHLKPPCKNGDPCHERAPRGSRTGLQGIQGKVLRSVYPDELCNHIVLECEKYLENK